MTEPTSSPPCSGLPPIPAPAALSSIDCTGIVLGNDDIAINHPDAVGVQQEPPCAN